MYSITKCVEKRGEKLLVVLSNLCEFLFNSTFKPPPSNDFLFLFVFANTIFCFVDESERIRDTLGMLHGYADDGQGIVAPNTNACGMAIDKVNPQVVAKGFRYV